MREIVVRRGARFYEWRYREDKPSKYQTTKIPIYPECEKPARCRWCEGIQIGATLLIFPLVRSGKYDKYLHPILRRGAHHVVIPPNGCHLVAQEWCQFNPNEVLKAGWELTDEEKAAGKKGVEWPEDV